MSLEEKINKDITASMKAGDKLRTETLRLIRASIIELNKRGLNREINEEEELSVLVSAAKKRKEAIQEFKNAGRLEMAQKEEDELKIIQEYMPEQLSEEEITEKLKDIITATGASGTKDFGKVMPIAIQELKGKADGKLIQTILKRLL